MKYDKCFIIVLLLINNLSCSENNKLNISTFHFDKQATLVIRHNSQNNNHLIIGRYLPFLSPDYINDYKFTEKLILGNNPDSILNYKISIPCETYLIIDRKLWLPVFLVPDDTLYMSLNLSDSSKIIESIKFKGNLASINEFQIARYKRNKKGFDEICLDIFGAKLAVIDMQRKIDSISTIESNFINEYLKNYTLPDWYLVFLNNQLTYKAAYYKLYNLNYRKGQNIEEEKPNNYYDFLNDIKINNEDAATSCYYYYFMHQYCNMLMVKDSSVFNPIENKKLIGLKELQLADNLLNGEIESIFKSYIISEFIIDQGLNDLAGEIIEEQKDKIIPKYRYYLKKYLQDRMTLKEGTKAPPFYLLNSNNEIKTLTDYKGKVVLLNFWFPGCTGCRLEIPYEEKLINDFMDADFKLINVCFTGSEEIWQKAVKEFGMKGINLYANENWQKKLIENYRIAKYPHYTLIDKEGNIYTNLSKRPSEGVSEDIKMLLLK